jgi:hypothetical protein
MHPQTVAQWQQRTHGTDAPMGPTPPQATVLTQAPAARSVACRRQTLRPLDAGLSALPATLPHRTRSALHRCGTRPGLNRWPDRAGDTPAKHKFQPSPMGSLPLDLAAVRTADGQRCLGVAIDRTGPCACAERPDAANTMSAAPCRRHLLAAGPDTSQTGLTDHGRQCTPRQRDQDAFRQLFDRVCPEPGLEHRRTQVNHPWTNGPVARMHRTFKAVSGQPYDEPTPQPLQDHLQACLMADNVANSLNTLSGLTPDAHSCPCWPKEPERCTINPDHHTLGLNT